jgi:hypothetical protein
MNTLSERLQNLNLNTSLTIDSSQTENILNESIQDIIMYAKTLFTDVIKENSISLFECQQIFHNIGGPAPNINNKKFSMKPDGGIIYAKINGRYRPILIVEDKVQGTNDLRFKNKLKKQATGNAIERASKNIRGAEMIFSDIDIFPYIIFASGCDFHSSETISKRIDMMNFGYPSHFIELNPNTTNDQIQEKIEEIIDNIDLNKKIGKSIASVFIKSHKWDEMEHGASRWKKEEINKILLKIIYIIFEKLGT